MGKTIEEVGTNKLEGNTIEITLAGVSYPHPVEIAGCDYDVGISIVSKENHDETDGWNSVDKGEQVLCLHGPSSPHRKSYERSFTKYDEAYDGLFERIVQEIKDGHVTTNINDFVGENTQQPSLWALLTGERDGSIKCGFE